MISCQYVWENSRKHSRSLFAGGEISYVEDTKTAQGIVCTDARGPSHHNTEKGCQMDNALVAPDSILRNSHNAGRP